MADWEVWRQDDNGNRYLVAAHHDRVQALAQVMIFEAGHPHKQSYEIVGERVRTVHTNRDLYLRLVAVGEHLSSNGRALLDYLCSLWTVSRPLAVYDVLNGDLLAAMLTAAVWAPPARPEPAWRVADLSVNDAFSGFADFTKVLCTQITDLLAFQENPPGPYASLGVDAPPRVDGGRATVDCWCNFDPATYLECAAAGSFGGWSVADGRRVTVAGLPGDGPNDEVTPLPRITWGDVGAFLEYGQCYE
jgi:hypothetical protein